MSIFKVKHKLKPKCIECKFMPCKLTYKECNEKTGWIKPCLQNCEYHNHCIIEKRDNEKGEITYYCHRYKPIKLKIGFILMD